MKIVNNNKKARCCRCGRDILGKRKVRWSMKKYLHLSCCYDWALLKFNEWRKIKNHLSKYKRDIVIERLK